MFVSKQVFDPALEGKAAIVSGLTIGDKVVLIGEVHDDKIGVVDQSGLSMFLKSEDFRQGELSLEVLEPKPPKPLRTTPGGKSGRHIDKKYMRSEQTIQADDRMMISILQGYPNGLFLRDIIKNMIKAGQTHWGYPKTSASGYIAHMIRRGLPIEKVDYGRYRYTGGEK